MEERSTSEAPPSRSLGRRLGRALVIALAGVLGLAVIVAIALAVALERPGVQQRVLEGISDALEPELGIAISADGFELGLLGGRLEIHGLELRAGSAQPFARIRTTRVRFRPLTLLRGPLRLALLELEEPEIDADAQFPASEAAPEAEPLESLELVIDGLRVEGGRVRGTAPEAASRILRDWRIADIEARGAFDGRRLTVSKMTAGAQLGRGAREPIRVEVEVAAAFELTGAGEVDRLVISGDELSLDASLRLASDWEESSAQIRLTADPGAWLGERPSGDAKLEAEVDLSTWRGFVRLEAANQRARLASDLGLLAEDLADALELPATSLDLRLDLTLDRGPDGVRRVAGEAGAVARRDGTTVLEVDARPRGQLRPGPLADALGHAELEAGLEARLLPGEPGRRTATALLASPDAASGDSWRIERGEAAVDAPSVERLLAAVGGLYPKLVSPTAVREMPSIGSLSATADFGGGLDDPRVDARARVVPKATGRIDLAVRGRPLSGTWDLDAIGVDLELAQFTTAARGRLSFDGRVRDVLGSASVDFEVAGRELGTEAGPLFAALDAEVGGSRERLTWKIEGTPAAGGSVRTAGALRPERPLRSADGTVDWETVDLRVPRVDGRFELSGGRLSASVRAPVVAADSARERPAEVEVELDLPLGALDALPQLGDLSRLPVERAQGPARLSWSVPPTEWRGFLPAGWIEAIENEVRGVGSLEAGSTGELVVDLDCLTCSTGAAALQGVVVEVAGRRARAADDLRLRIGAGEVEVEPWSLTGDGLELELSGKAGLSPGWRPPQPLAEAVTDSLVAFSAIADSTWLEPIPLEVSTPGTISLRGRAAGPPRALVASVNLSAPDLRFAFDAYPSVTVERLAAEATLDAGFVEWKNVVVAVNDAVLTSEGRALLEAPLATTAGTLEVASGLPVLTAAELPFEIVDGRLVVDDGRVTTDGGAGTIRLDMPVGGGDGAAARLEWDLPVNDWAALLEAVQGLQDPEVVELGSRGSMTLPLDRPTAAEAAVDLTSGRLVVRGRETRIEPNMKITLREGELQVAPFRLRTVDESFLFEARASLKDAWAPGDDPAELVTDFRVLGAGDVDAGLLNPFLAGGRAEGSLNLDFEIAGSPSEYGGRLDATGPDASIVFRTPYLARFESPDLEIRIRDGTVELERASLRLNEGALEAAGSLAGGGGTDLGLRFTDSVFRLDYGLVVTLRGDLRYRLEATGDSQVSGVVNVERGALTRTVQLDLDLLSQLLAPIDLTTTEDDPLDLVALDLEVRTREGIRVKNNLGDLLVRWEPLQVTGTLLRPVIEGRLEVDSGGLLYAYGQTVRLDKAVIEYPGEYGVEPRLDFEATTSLEDPTIGQLAGADPFKATFRTQEQAATPASQEITADLARYYGEQVAGKVGESVGVSVSLRPLLIFGETDPGARLTVSRDLSPNLALAASIDLTGAEARTYLLELHELRVLPRLVAQAFTDDGANYGGALLQRQEWGGSRPEEAGDLPRISRIVATPPKGVSRRGLKRALGLDKGSAFDPDQRFVAEIEMVDYLMRKGYPDAKVSVRAKPDPDRKNRVVLEIPIEPGPHVSFAFEGEKIPDPLKLLIRSLYRPDFFEAESIEEMRAETVRALRSRGFLDPEVEITVEQLDARGTEADRRVTVRTSGRERISPEPPIFLGVPPEDVEILNVTFANAVQRVELAVGLPSADRRLLATLASLGYPEARVVSRYQSLGERVLTVEIDPGPRERIAGVSVEGLANTEAREIDESQITPLLAVAEGDPLRRVRLSRSAIAVERYLARQGYLDARVRTVLEPHPAGDPYAKSVRFEVETGRITHLEGIDFQGLRSTRESFARRVAGLETGKPLSRQDLDQARTSLWKTGLFGGVGADIVTTESGLDRVVFDLEERARYRLTYGVRWDSEDGVGAVVDATDDNFLGRGWTLGARVLTSNDEDSLRLLARVPRAFGGPGALELYGAVRQFSETTIDVIFGAVEVPVEVFESTLQYSHPFTPRTTFRMYGRYTDSKRELPFFTLRVKNPQLGFQYVFDSRSSEPIVERGIFASVDLSGSREFLGGDLAYVRTFSQFSLYRPVGKLFGSRLLWSQSYRVGLAEAYDQVLTRDVRFFAGGEYSVRGYLTESLGEQETFGSVSQPVGGAALLVINQELRWRLFEDYTLVLFGDAGNVWPALGDFGSDLFTSAGLGARAVTPVGLLRLDVARPLAGRPGIDPEYKIYFGLGTSF